MPGPANLAFGNVANQFVLSVAVSTASVGANTTAERTFTVQGLRAGIDVITAVNKPTHQTGLGIVNARVSANDTLALTYMNNTGGGITPTAESYLLVVDRAGYDTAAQIPTAIG